MNATGTLCIEQARPEQTRPEETRPLGDDWAAVATTGAFQSGKRPAT